MRTYFLNYFLSRFLLEWELYGSKQKVRISIFNLPKPHITPSTTKDNAITRTTIVYIRVNFVSDNTM